MLDGQVGRANGRQGPGSALDVGEFPVQPKMRPGAWLQPGLDHQLFGHAGEANAHDRPGVLALLLGGLAERGEQRIGLHLLLVPPEAQSDLAARAHDAARFTQGIETVPPNASKARGHVEAVIVERQIEHITDSDVGRGGTGRGDGCQPFRGIETGYDGAALACHAHSKTAPAGDIEVPRAATDTRLVKQIQVFPPVHILEQVGGFSSSAPPSLVDLLPVHLRSFPR